MKLIRTFLFTVLAAAVAVGCKEKEKPGTSGLNLEISETSVEVDTPVRFTVRNNGTKVSDAVIVELESGEEVKNGKYTPLYGGTYRFQAEYQGLKSNEVSLEVTDEAVVAVSLSSEKTFVGEPLYILVKNGDETVSEGVVLKDLDSGKEITSPFIPEKAGKYRIQAEYRRKLSEEVSFDVLDKTLSIEVSDAELSVGESVEFTVKDASGKDITSSAKIMISSTGEEVSSDLVMDEAGAFVFRAEAGGEYSDEVKVYVYSGERKSLLQKFTATWCQYCPSMTSAISSYMEKNPGMAVSMSVHASDVLAVEEGTELGTRYGIMNFPTLVVDAEGKVMLQSESATVSNIKEAVQAGMDGNTEFCDLAAGAVLKGSELIVNVGAKAASGSYGICIALLQNGIKVNGGKEPDGIYNHVLRGYATSIDGESTGDLSDGMFYTCSKSISVSTSWPKENLSVIVYALRSDGMVSNAVEVPVM